MAMKSFRGKGVYGAVAIGMASVFKRQEADVRRVHIDDTAAELERVEAAKAKAIEQLSEIYEKRSRRSARPTRRSSRYT